MILTESEDAVIQTAAPRVVAGRKWTPSEAVQSAKSALHFRDVVDKYSMGGQGSDSSQKLLCGIKQDQCTRDS